MPTVPTNVSGRTVAIRRLTSHLRQTTPRDIPATAEFAVVASTAAGDPVALITDAEVINILATARAVADELTATFVAPEATCEYCARPVPAGARYCPPQPLRDCAGSSHGSETTYRRPVAA